jgi:eukaryotic-like serine/threonine-protein kinase
MVLEFLEGLDLGALVTRRGPLPISDAVTYVLEACEAIAEAHSLGIVHRDLKPDNLFLATRSDGTKIVKVLDFGISKFSSSMDDKVSAIPSLTTTSAIIGSPIYMSPEQLKSTRDVDHRTDIWSIGVALYELIAGQPPFPWRNMAELSAAILKDTPVPLSTRIRTVSPELDRVIMRCLEKNPDNRHENIAELAWALVPFGKPEALHSAERASELLARAPKRVLKRSNTELEKRQAVETQSDGTSAVSRKIIAVPAGVSRPAAATATTKDLLAVSDSLPAPILRGLPIAAIFALVILVLVSNRHLRSSFESAPNVGEAKRGLAQTISWMLATYAVDPKIETPKTTEKKEPPAMMNSASTPRKNPPPLPKKSGQLTREGPKIIPGPKPTPLKRRNPYADRE